MITNSFDNEQWKPIADFPRYTVSDHGRIMNALSGKILNGGFDRDGYCRVCLRTDTEKKSKQVHSLVAAAFIGPRPTGLHVNHIDGEKTNNHVSNLEYVTSAENTRHAIRLGLNDHKGENHGMAKLNETEVKGICRLLADGIKGRYLAGFYGVSEYAISDIKTGRAWGHLPEVQAAAKLPSGRKSNRPTREICSIGGKAATSARARLKLDTEPEETGSEFF